VGHRPSNVLRQKDWPTTKQHDAELTPRTLSFRCGGVKINAGAVNSEMIREQLEEFSQLARITSG